MAGAKCNSHCTPFYVNVYRLLAVQYITIYQMALHALNRYSPFTLCTEAHSQQTNNTSLCFIGCLCCGNPGYCISSTALFKWHAQWSPRRMYANAQLQPALKLRHTVVLYSLVRLCSLTGFIPGAAGVCWQDVQAECPAGGTDCGRGSAAPHSTNHAQGKHIMVGVPDAGFICLRPSRQPMAN